MRYSFQITNGETFVDVEDLANDAAAWREAVTTVRDIESSLSPNGGRWSLEVAREDAPIFRIDITVVKIGG